MSRFKLQKSQILDAAILILATEFRQSAQILLDKELRKTKRGVAFFAASAASGILIGTSFTSVASQIGAVISGSTVDITYGDLVFGTGTAIQIGIHFLKKHRNKPIS